MINQKIDRSLLIAGNHAEYIIYKTPKYTHYGQPPPPRRNNEKSENSLSRTRIRLYRLVSSNLDYCDGLHPTFCTLTYARNESNRKVASRELRLYHLRLSYHTGKHIRYIAIPEFQKRGAIHYHIIYFNLPFVPVEVLAKKIWGNGNVDIHCLDQVRNTSAYAAKYITKETLDARHKGHRILITSRGLRQPITVYNEDVDFYHQITDNKPVSRLETDDRIILTYDCKSSISSYPGNNKGLGNGRKKRHFTQSAVTHRQ